MALISTLADTFSGTSLDSKWSASIPSSPGGSTVTVGGGCLNLTQDVKAVSVYSVDSYDFTNSSFYAVVSPPLRISVSGGSFPEVAVTETTLALRNNLSTIASVAYVSNNMGLIRMSFTSSTVSLEYSGDGVTWTSVGSTAATVPTSAVLQFQVGQNGKTGRIHSFNEIEPDTYTVGSGNWSARSVWSNVSGGHPGALAPGINSHVFVENNKGVDLDYDASVSSIDFSYGNLNIANRTLICQDSFSMDGSSSKSLSAGNGTIEIKTGGLYIGGTGTISSGSTLTIAVNASPSTTHYTNTYANKIGHLKLLHHSTGSGSIELGSAINANLLSIEAEGPLTVNAVSTIDLTHLRSIRDSSGGRTTITAPTGFWFAENGTCNTAHTDISTPSMLSTAYGGNTYYPLYLMDNLAGAITGNITNSNPGPGSSLRDDFDGAVLDSSLWVSSTYGSGYVNLAAGSLVLGYIGGTSGFSVTAKKSYNILESAIEFEVNACDANDIRIELLGSKAFGSLDAMKLVDSFSAEEYRIAADDLGNGSALVHFDRKVSGDWATVSSFTAASDMVVAVRPRIYGDRNLKNDSLIISKFGGAVPSTNNFLAFFEGV